MPRQESRRRSLFRRLRERFFKRRKFVSKFSPQLEPLEERRLLAITGVVTGTTVAFTGNAATDTATFAVDGSGFLTLNGSTDLNSDSNGNDLLVGNITFLTYNDSGNNDTVNFQGSNTFNFSSGLNISVGESNAPLTLFVNQAINVSGSGAVNMTASRNILMNGAAAITTVAGGITLNANQGATSTPGNYPGIHLNPAQIVSATGDIRLTGRGGTSGGVANQQRNMGVQVTGASLIESTGTSKATAGIITLDGIGGTSGRQGYGVRLHGPLTVRTVAGDISLTGLGATDNDEFNEGVAVSNGAQVVSNGTGDNAADITINGTGRGGILARGFVSHETGTISSVDGDISITGSAQGVGTGSHGIWLINGVDIRSTGSGDVTLTGTGGNQAAANVGTLIWAVNTEFAQVSTASGDLTITGNGGSGGVLLANSSTVSVGSGTMRVTGTATNTGRGVGIGVHPSNGGSEIGSLLSTGAGAISVTGTGAGGTAGVEINNASSVIGGNSAAGDITVTTDSFTGSAGTIRSSGDVTFKPLTPSATIGVAGGTGLLNLDTTEIGLLADGFSSITIGDSTNGTGHVDVNSSTFNDPVNVVGGSIDVDGLAAGSNAVNLIARSGGTISDGSSATDVTAGTATFDGNVSPGQSPGILNINGNFAFADNDTFTVEIGGTTPGNANNNHDQIAATGGVTIGNNVILSTSSFNGFSPNVGQEFTIVERNGGTGTFAGLPEGAEISNFLGSNLTTQISYVGGDGDDIVLLVNGLLGVNFSGSSAFLYDVNPATGATSNARNMGTIATNGLTRDSNGIFYTVTQGGQDSLRTVNISNGLTTVVGPIGFNVSEGDLDFDPITGDLYGTNSSGETLMQINKATGAATTIGPISTVVDPSAMAFDSTGTLYILESAQGRLLTVNKTNAAVLTNLTLTETFGVIAGMDFHPVTGTLYVASGTDGSGGTLYTVNTSTGLVTTVGPTTGAPDGLGGLEFIGVAQPASPEIDIQGLGLTILDGDATPSSADDTDFGLANIANGLVSHTFTILNTGNADLNLTGSPVVDVAAGDFLVTMQPAATTLAPSASTTFVVQFDPSVLGSRFATISIANDDADENPYNFTIAGEGINPPSVCEVGSPGPPVLAGNLNFMDEEDENDTAGGQVVTHADGVSGVVEARAMMATLDAGDTDNYDFSSAVSNSDVRIRFNNEGGGVNAEDDLTVEIIQVGVGTISGPTTVSAGGELPQLVIPTTSETDIYRVVVRGATALDDADYRLRIHTRDSEDAAGLSNNTIATATDIVGTVAEFQDSDNTITFPDRDFYKFTALDSAKKVVRLTLPVGTGSNSSQTNLGVRVRDVDGRILASSGAWNEQSEEFVVFDATAGEMYFVEVYSGSHGQVNRYDLSVANAEGVICGFKFHDSNQDGIWNRDEGPIAGWTVTLDDGSSIVATNTDANGLYQFTVDQADFGGTFTVSEALPGGYFQTFPEPGPNPFVPAGVHSVTIDDWNLVADHLDFGNGILGSVHGFKFEDVDADGVYSAEAGDQPWSDLTNAVTFQLQGDFDGPDGTAFTLGSITTTTTDATGQFWFENLFPGSYTLTEVALSSPFFATKDPSPVRLDVESGEEYVWQDGAAMTLLPGQFETNIGSSLMFGNAVLGSIHGFKFADANANGVYDPPADTALMGITIQLTGDIDGNATIDVTTVQTDAAGEFSFENLYPGPYTLSEIDLPAFSLPSNDNARNGITLTVGSREELVWSGGAAMLGPGSPQAEVNVGASLMFANTIAGSIHGVKFEDQNGDGDLTADVAAGNRWPVSPAITFRLDGDINGDGTVGTNEFDTTQTDGNGEFSFEGLFPGTYQLSEINLPSHVVATAAAPRTLVITSGQELAWTVGAAGLPPSGDPRSEEVVGDTLVFGNAIQGSIHGLKFKDLNGDGVLNAGEQGGGLAGVTFVLTGGTLGGPLTMLSDGSGEWGFGGLLPGTYHVREEVPAFMTPTNNLNGVTLTLESGQEFTWTSGQAGDISLLAGQTRELNQALAFGNFLSNSVIGFKFEDLDGDGVQDAGETGLPGVVIELEFQSSGASITTTSADGTGTLPLGWFAFNNLPADAGGYLLSEDLSAQPQLAQTAPMFPFNTAFGSNTSGTGFVWSVGAVGMLNAGQTATTLPKHLTFGNTVRGAIHGLKFIDTDGNGSRSGGEPVGAGFQFSLTGDPDGNGPLGVTTLFATTAADGKIDFPNLYPGNWMLNEVASPDPLFAKSDPTQTPVTFTVDSGEVLVHANGAHGGLFAGQTQSNEGGDLEFGNIVKGSIHGLKFLDADRNRTFNEGDNFTGSAIDGLVFTFELEGDTDGDGNSETVVVVTDGSSGDFAFTGLHPGPYTLREINLPLGLARSTPSAQNGVSLQLLSGQEFGWAGGVTGHNATYQTEVVNSGLAFGNIIASSIHGFKFGDSDLDGTIGVYDPGIDTPRDGVLFTLIGDADGDGATDMITALSVAGNFSFERLFPGSYRVAESTPFGTSSTTHLSDPTNPSFTLSVAAETEYAWMGGASNVQGYQSGGEVVQPSLTFGNQGLAGALWQFDFNRQVDHDGDARNQVTPGTPCNPQGTTTVFTISGAGPNCWVSVPRQSLFSTSNAAVLYGWNSAPAANHEFTTSLGAGVGVPADYSEVHQDGYKISNNKIYSVRVPDASATYRVTLIRTGVNNRALRLVYENNTTVVLSSMDGDSLDRDNPWAEVPTGSGSDLTFDIRPKATGFGSEGILNIGLRMNYGGLGGMIVEFAPQPSETLSITPPGAGLGTGGVYTITGLDTSGSEGSYVTVYTDNGTGSFASADASTFLRATQDSVSAVPRADTQLFDSNNDGTVTFSFIDAAPTGNPTVYAFEYAGGFGSAIAPLPLLSNAPPVSNPQSIGMSDLNGVIDSALNIWSTADLSDSQLAELRAVEFRVQDLDFYDGALGLAYTDRSLVVIDNDAAGTGWSIDARRSYQILS